jgi:hypothetical protein
MATPITTAGMGEPEAARPDPRKEAFRIVARTLRSQEASEDETVDALEALALLSRED